MDVRGRLRTFSVSNKGRQFAGLLSANVLGVPISFVSNIVITSYLGAALYGDFQFLYTIFNTANIILNFGIFHAVNRAIILSNSQQQTREYYGVLLILILFVSVVMSIAIGLFAILDNNVSEKGMNGYLLFLLPFSGVFMLNQCFETILQADNQIRLLSYCRILPKVMLLLGGLISCFIIQDKIADKLIVILVAYVFALLSVYVYIYVCLRPSFNNLKKRLLELLLCEKKYGIDIYLGAIFAVGFAQFSDILISYFGPDNTNLGYYKLAVQFCTPLSFIPMTLANTHFKDFSKSARIEPKLIKLTLFLSGIALFFLWSIVPIVIKWFFKPDFNQVILISIITSIGVLSYGLADFFNKFLAANGRGKILRNVSFVLGPIVMLFGILFIPKFGAYGAAYAKVCSGLCYFVIMYVTYKVEVLKSFNRIRK